MSERGPYLVLAAVIGGILTGERHGPGNGAPAIGLAVVALLGAVLVARARCPGSRPRHRRSWFAPVLVVVAFGLLGVAVTQRALHGLTRSPLSAAVASGATIRIDAVLAEDPDGPRYSTEVLARVGRFRPEHGQWRDGGGRTVLVAASGEAGTRIALLSAGDHVRLDGSIGRLVGFDERLRWRHAIGRFDADVLISFRSPTTVVMRVANAARGVVLGGTAALPSTERALLAGFLLGDTRGLSPEVVVQFRGAGLSHLMAVSGENVAFALALVGPVLRRLRRYARLVAMIGLLVVFGAMTRWEPSVLRAEAMVACSVLATHLGRPARAVRTLALAVTALLLVDPFLLHSVGFLLSCGASLGITCLGPRIAASMRGPEWVRASLATTTAAQLGVAPVALPVFGSMPLVAIPANLLAGPIAGPLTTWGLGAGVLGGILGRRAPMLASLVQLPTRWLADAMLGVADAASRVPIALDVRSTLLGAAGVGLATLVVHSRRTAAARVPESQGASAEG